MTNKQNNIFFERIEEILNWTLPGLTMYYRDSNLNQKIIDKYEVGKVFRSQIFVDVSNFAGKPTTNCRFIIASSKAAQLSQINPEMEKWGLHTINCNSYFKVLDIYKQEGITQVFLIHIPYKGIDFFSKTVLLLEKENIEKQIIRKARESLNQKLKSEIPAILNEKKLIERTRLPIGLNHKNKFCRLEVIYPLRPEDTLLYSAIKKMTKDLSDLNETSISKKKGRFWLDLFGKV